MTDEEHLIDLEKDQAYIFRVLESCKIKKGKISIEKYEELLHNTYEWGYNIISNKVKAIIQYNKKSKLNHWLINVFYEKLIKIYKRLKYEANVDMA